MRETRKKNNNKKILFLYATFKLSIATFSSTMRACVQDQFSHIVYLPLGPAPFFIGQQLFQRVYCFVVSCIHCHVFHKEL